MHIYTVPAVKMQSYLPLTPSALPFSPSKDAGQIVELVRSLSGRQLAPLAGALSFSQHDIPGGNLHFFGVHCFIV